jgi:hypothetical protein
VNDILGKVDRMEDDRDTKNQKIQVKFSEKIKITKMHEISIMEGVMAVASC